MVETAGATNNERNADLILNNLHYRASLLYLKYTNRNVRSLLEIFWMILAVSGFAALICLHLAFVYRGNPAPVAAFRNVSHHNPLRNIPASCLSSIDGFRSTSDITHLILLEDDEPQESIAWELGTQECLALEKDQNQPSCRVAKMMQYSSNFAGRVQFTYAKTKGYALLSPDLSEPLRAHGISTQIVAVSKTDVRCFGEPFLQTAIFHVLGHDLVMMNWLLAISNGTGYVHNPRTEETVDLGKLNILNVRNTRARPTGDFGALFGLVPWIRPWASKVRTVIKTCLIYFISTNLVSFLLRVAQESLLELALQIRSHQEENRSIIPLFVTHVADAFVFVPITVGVLFYLREFYQGDWVIALSVLGIVFVGELFSFVSVRTAQGIFFFPRAFFLLFFLVHSYIFSFPFAFSNLAMFMIICFMMESFTFFWNRYEVPAVAGTRENLDGNRGNDANNVEQQYTLDAARQESALSLSPATTTYPRSHHSSGGAESPNRSPEHVLRVTMVPQHHQQGQLHYTYSQGRMSRSSSQAIFRTDDDGSESCLFFLDGEVVIPGQLTSHTAANRSDNQPGEATARMRRAYDSMSTLQSAVGQFGTITDEAAASGLQAIYDLSPYFHNSVQGPAIGENTMSTVPSFSTLDSSRFRGARQRHRGTD
ncbi:Tumour-associated protein [Seminavis robusta]|uniref:Tumour-associated protein n=1 Tax=Seminavis robusta TaxID=568900 RepID=A0A9N8DQT0_9STRA|nr:Tumour-associated protein [Seminavis robusta]|eukprot:Sro305_g112790.1 Tumour-associated protein (653) ;mRNA; r:48367-50415